ncbi:MAG: aldehyde-activating protein [Proteobacteria bacterium]|nr:aldehyde-activating protein [Pseudomonadota bacterium]
MAVTGGCRCGAVRYRIEAQAMPATYACHCTRCQTSSGSAFALQMPVKLDRLAVEGEVLSVELPTASGAVSDIRHCPACLTRLYGVSSAVPGIAIMRAGTLDDSASLVPGLHVFTSTKQPWIALPEGVPAFAESPPPEVWRQLLA